ncbi:aquaporin-like protein [Aspergillus bertholletiae]|uniref:Aquaporin-like protein n=1 Tax=Aspergillus bertholletiae TaxID=1226010 RepID=A0A5N7AVY0_9EURO|nr:aquaporin-like protein [Aspergillus bertholletiae]
MAVPYLPEYEQHAPPQTPTPAIAPFAGRLGGNQDFVVDRSDPRNDKVLEKVPDAAPWMTLSEIVDLRGFGSLDLWKFACLECIASMMNVFISAWVTLHAPAAVEAPKTEVGIYHTLTFFSPLFGGITNLLLTPLLIYTFAPSSGGHVSPTITLATLFARIISLPRAVLYLAGQTLGGTLAGFALHTAYGSRDFTVGGCHVDTSLVPVNAAFIIEFFACLVLIFLAFGVALDPRQAKVFGHAAGPWLVGIVLGVVCWATAFTRPGYIGASLNPARCFGVYVASEFPSYHWVHWVAPLAAAAAHGLVYFIDPLWSDPR